MSEASGIRRDTIFALSSGGLPSGVAVIRLSGPDARFALETIAGECPAPRQAVLRRLRDPKTATSIDEALVLWFPGPKSFTGEDIVELQCHGGRAVVSAVLQVLSAIDGCRPAEPGEFTRRAFDNDRMDLLQAEGLADLITAETEAQRRQALTQMEGALGSIYEGWRDRLIRARALIEAEFDFADEEDVPSGVSDAIWSDVEYLNDEMQRHLDDGHRGERLRSGLQVALIGRPNAGKSSLLNGLARRDVAIVTEEAGTTRDVIEVHLDLDGYPLTIADTAGLRETDGIVEREGIRRGLDRARKADLVLALSEPMDPMSLQEIEDIGLDAETVVWRIDTKSDLIPHDEVRRYEGSVDEEDCKRLSVTVRTRDGLSDLLQALQSHAVDVFGRQTEPVATRARHRRHLIEAVAALQRAVCPEQALELRAEDLRSAGESLGRLSGRIDVEDMLDVIFREFCIGK